MARKFTAADVEITAKDRTKTGVDSAKSGVGKLTDTVKRYGVEIAAVMVAINKVKRVIKDLSDAYMQQEQAVVKMETALKATGVYTPQLSGKLQGLARELQKTTIYGDETTLAATGLLQSLAKLSDEGLGKAVPLVHDLAAGLGIDLEGAASLIGKTLGSTTNALSRYGINLDATASQSQKLAELTEQVNKAFGGMAKAMGETFQGRLMRLKNAWGDIKEIIGKFLLEQAEPVIAWLTDFLTNAQNIQTLTKILQVFGAAFGTVFGMVHRIIANTIDAVKLMIKAWQAWDTTVQVIFDPKRWGKGEIAAALKELSNQFVQNVDNLIEGWYGFAQKTGERWKNVFTETTQENIKTVRNQYQIMTDENEEALNAIAMTTKTRLGEVRAEYESFLSMRYMWGEEVGEVGPSYEAIRHAEEYAGAIAHITSEVEELTKKQQEMASIATDAFTAFGQAFADTAIEGGNVLKEAMKAAISSILMMLGKMAMVEAGLAFARLQFLRAAALTGAGTVAFIAAGAVKALKEGGWLTEPVIGTGLRTGTTYTMAETGPEYVSPAGRGGVNIYVRGSLITEGQLADMVAARIGRRLRGY